MGFEEALCTSPLERRDGVGKRGRGGGGEGRGGWLAGSEVTERVEKTGVSGEGEPVTMTSVSRSVAVRECCWISSHPLISNRSVQKSYCSLFVLTITLT